MPTLELLTAYCRTDYRAELSNRYVSIRVGSRSPEVERLLTEVGQEEWALVTAENPRSSLLAASANKNRRERLQRRLDGTNGVTIFPALARCPADQWPPERGHLIIGISVGDALEIARAFDQHAILCGRAGAQATLRFSSVEEWRAALDSGLDSDDDAVRWVCREVLAAQAQS